MVCAKNEAQNLSCNLPFLIGQNYPKFEIVLINDASRDNTLEVMQGFLQLSSRIKIIDFAGKERFPSSCRTESESKKNALTAGIKSARHQHLLFIDADCRPVSDQWIFRMAAGFSNQKEIVLGYGAYEKISSSWLNKIIRYETLLTALQYFGYAKNKNPYMGVGRNLGYTKTLFEQQSGFKQHLEIPAGDDDLFINGAATATNTTMIYSSGSFTVSSPKKTWRSWFRQKRRHTGVAKYYKAKHKAQLGLFYISQMIFLIPPLPLFLLLPQFSLIVAFAIIFRYVLVWWIIGRGAQKLEENDLIYYFPLLELLLIPLQLSIFIANIISTPKHWN